MDAAAAMRNDRMTPGPAIALATKPATTYMPVPTQLPTPRDTRSTVVRTLASPTTDPSASSVRSSEPGAMEPTGLVLRRRQYKLEQASPKDSRWSHAAIAGPACALLGLAVCFSCHSCSQVLTWPPSFCVRFVLQEPPKRRGRRLGSPRAF